jgi:hypothetical protein
MYQEDAKWLEELKTGDPVFVVGGGWRGRWWEPAHVVSKTPTGRIKVRYDNCNTEQTFRPDGSDVAKPSKWDSRDYLRPYSDEKLLEIQTKEEQKRLAGALNNMGFGKCTIDQLRRIHAIIQEGKDGAN